MRAQPTDNKTPRSQNTPVAKRRTVQLTLWTNPIVKAEIQRIAKREGLSDSAVGAAFLEKALQQNADLEYGALLRPIIESAIKDNLQTMSTRLALLLRCWHETCSHARWGPGTALRPRSPTGSRHTATSG